jgi:hypothetical protein
MEPLIMQFPPPSCHFIPLRSKYSPKHPVLEQWLGFLVYLMTLPQLQMFLWRRMTEWLLISSRKLFIHYLRYTIPELVRKEKKVPSWRFCVEIFPGTSGI